MCDVVFVAEDRKEYEGYAGRLLDQCLTQSGLSLDRVKKLVVGAGLQSEIDLSAPKLVVGLGEVGLQEVCGWENIMKWRGSLIPAFSKQPLDPKNRYWEMWPRNPGVSLDPETAFVATFSPTQVDTMYEWHVWLLHDLKRVANYLVGDDYEMKDRAWFIEKPEETERLIYEVLIPHERLVAIDTEMNPQLVSLVSEEEVHVFVFSERYRKMLEHLMSSPFVLKAAHNMAHDWRQFEKDFSIPVSKPYYDTLCLAHIMEPSGSAAGDRDKAAGTQQVGKSLSPHIATRFTPWPYHKWLVDISGHIYCGMDTVVCYDAYWEQIKQCDEKQMRLAEFDTRLFEPLFDMQTFGIKVDVAAREEVMESLSTRCDAIAKEFVSIASGIVVENLSKTKKPHLFMVMKQCGCCGGGKIKSRHCPVCSGVEDLKKATLVEKYGEEDTKGMKKDEIIEKYVGACVVCGGEGKVEFWKDIALSKGQQIADIFYRCLGVPARKFQGKETTRIEQMERLLEPTGFLSADRSAHGRRKIARELLLLYSEWNRANTDFKTAERITTGWDGRARCNFDLWYTPTSRVASRETLLDPGTNLQNIPLEARRLFIPDDGHFMIYPDYAQVEGRSMAVITQDEALLAEYAKENADSHQLVADMVTALGVPMTRLGSKRTFFATAYGVEAPHLASILGCSVQEAQRIIDAIFKAFPGVRRMRQRVEQEIRRSSSVTSIEGWRRRWLGRVVERRGRRKGEVLKKVIKEGLASNPQYMGARVMGEGLLQLYEACDYVQPLAHVHDASLSQAPLERKREAILDIERYMAVDLWGMHFPVDASAGPNWYVASLSDEKKIQEGYGEWTREAILSN